MVEVDIFEPLYKFKPEVAELAKKIPQIKDILVDLKNRNIPMHITNGHGGLLHFDFIQKGARIELGTTGKPIDILSYLVHEYYHILLHTKTFAEIYSSKEYYVLYMMNQELYCYSEQAEFVMKYQSLGREVSDQTRLLFSYKKGNLLDYLEAIILGEHVGYSNYYSNGYIDWSSRGYLLDWRLNDEESRIPIGT